MRSSREALKKSDPSYSLRQLAARIGVKPSYLSRIERGEAAALSEEKTIALARELDVNPDVLLALSGKISSDVQDVIRKRPELFAELVRDFKDLPDRAVLAGKEYRLVESRLSEAQKMARIGNWEVEVRGRNINQAVKGVGGGVYRSEELFRIFETEVGDPRVRPDYLVDNLIVPEDREYVRREYYERYPETGSVDMVFRFRTLSGNLRHAHVTGIIEYDESGRPDKLRGTFQDVTRERESEEALRLSEERYRAVVEDQTDSISRFRADGTFLFVNDVYCRFFGKSREELIGNKWQPVAVPEDLPHIEEQLEKLSPDNPVVVIENRVYSGTGEIRCMQFVNRAFFSDKGELLEIQSVGRDITERREMERELRQSEHKYRLLAENVGDLVTLADADLMDVYASPSVRRLLGYRPEEYLRLSRERLLTPDSLALMRAAWDRLKRVWSGGEKMKPGYKMELEFIHRDGSIVPTEMSSSPLIENGRFTGILNVIRDISDRKAAEERFRVTDIKLSGILDHSSSIIQMKDTAGRYLLVNRRYEELFGITADQIVGKTPYDMHEEHLAESMLEYDRSVYESGKSVTLEETVSTVHGAYTLLTTKFPLVDDAGEIYAVCGISTDITERKQAEQKLKESEEYYRLIFDTVDDMILVYEPDGRLLDVNRAVCRLLGYPMEDLPGMKKADMLTAAEAGRFGSRVEKLMARGRLYFESEYLSKEGRVIPVEVNARLMWRGGRRLVISVARDVSRRRRFVRERNRLTTALEHAAECIIVTDSNGHIQYVNPAFENITGYTREEITAKHVDILGYGAASRQRESILKELRSGGVWTGKLINRRKDGGEVEVEASISPVRDENGVITNYVAVERDTSYESKLERQLRQAQKMEAIGSLAGGIAHDLNNNLLPIIVNLEMVKDRMSDTKLQGRLADALASAGRARDMVRQILDFSRRSRGGRELMDLRDTVEEVLRAARVTAEAGVVLESAAADKAYRVDADPTQMHRAIFNMVANAVQSLGPEGGYVRVGLEHLEFKDVREAPHAEMPAGAYVAIKVTDSGSGIGIEDRDRIFEPFFTTKKPGNGVGLGLAVVHGIVLSHGGAMTVESEINQGSTFTAYLPAASDGGHRAKGPESKSNRASADSAEA